MRDNVVAITGASRRSGAELAMTPQGKPLQWLKLIAPGLVDRMARRAIESVR